MIDMIPKIKAISMYGNFKSHYLTFSSSRLRRNDTIMTLTRA